MKKILVIIFFVFLLFIKYEEHVDNKINEKFVGDDPYIVEHTDPLFVRYREQHRLTFKRNSDKVKNRFLYDQEDASDDYQIHAIYMLASDSSDKKLDVNGFIKDTLLIGNKKFSQQTKENEKVGKKFRLDRLKNWKIDISFIRLDESSKQINEKKNVAGYLTAMAVRNGFYKPNKIYSIFYQGKNKGVEAHQLGGALFRTPRGEIEVIAGITSLDQKWKKDPEGPWLTHLRETIKALGFVQLCVPNVMVNENSKWGRDYYLKYWNDIMSYKNPSRIIDKKKKAYYGHNNIWPKEGHCEMDLKKSAYLEPSEKDAQLQPRAISCKLSRHQKRYQHQKALDCLSRLAFQ